MEVRIGVVRMVLFTQHRSGLVRGGVGWGGGDEIRAGFASNLVK